MTKIAKNPKPIVLSSDMVLATLSERSKDHKNQIRFAFEPQPVLKLFGEESGAQHWDWKDCNWLDGGIGFPESGIEDYAPYKVGEILYAQEAWNHSCGRGKVPKGYHYEADGSGQAVSKWLSAETMPFEAARIFFRVTEIRVEQLWDIEKYPHTHPDIDPKEIYHAKGYLNEGLILVCSSGKCRHINGDCKDFILADTCALKSACKGHWNKRYAKLGLGWDTNPWVWVVCIERIENWRD